MTASVIDVRDAPYSAVPDAIRLTDGACTSGLPGLVCASGAFGAPDVGKAIKVVKGYTSDAVFRGTIASVTNATTIVLSGNCTLSASGTARVIYGTDNSTALNAAFSAAGSIPVNDGEKVKVIGPSMTQGGGYMFSSALSSDNIDIDFESPLYSNVGIGAGDTTIPWDLGNSDIGNLRMDVGGGRGPRWGNTGGHGLRCYGAYEVTNAGFNGQQYMTARGFGFDITGAMTGQAGSIGFDWSNCQDIHNSGYMNAIGANDPFIFNGCEDVQARLICDTTSFTSAKIDACRNVDLYITNFVNGSNTASTVKIGSVSTTTNRGIRIKLLAQASGSKAVFVDYCDGGVDIDIVATNKPLNSGVHNDITYAVEYGTHNSGTLNIRVARDSDIALYTGTLYGNLTDYVHGTSTLYAGGSESALDSSGVKIKTTGGFTGLTVQTYNANVDHGFWALDAARGTMASPGALQNGDAVALLQFRGHDGSSFQNSAAIKSTANGAISAGTVPGNLLFYTTTTGGSNSQKLEITANGNLVIGTAALSTTATDGFIYLPTCAGAPTGTPTAYTGRVAACYDVTNNKICVYNGGWKKGQLV